MSDIVNLDTHPEAHVTPAELAKWLNVGEQTVRDWIRKGSLPAKKYGQEWRIRTDDARAFGKPPEDVYRASGRS